VTPCFSSHFLDVEARAGSFVLEFCPLPFDGRSPCASRGQRVERRIEQGLRAVHNSARRPFPPNEYSNFPAQSFLVNGSLGSTTRSHYEPRPASCSLTCAQAEKGKAEKGNAICYVSPASAERFSLTVPYSPKVTVLPAELNILAAE